MVLPARPAPQPEGLRFWWKPWEMCNVQQLDFLESQLNPYVPRPVPGSDPALEHPYSRSLPAMKEAGTVPGQFCLQAWERTQLLLGGCSFPACPGAAGCGVDRGGSSSGRVWGRARLTRCWLGELWGPVSAARCNRLN